LQKAKQLLADKGDDAGSAPVLAKRGIAACTASKSNRKAAIPTAALYKRRNKIENMFGRLKDWRRIHTRSDRCATPAYRQPELPHRRLLALGDEF
jgi:putative transposase